MFSYFINLGSGYKKCDAQHKDRFSSLKISVGLNPVVEDPIVFFPVHTFIK